VNIRVIFIFSITALAAVSCAMRSEPPKLPEAESILESFEKKRDQERSLRARAIADTFSGSDRIRSRVDVFINTPDRVRVELVSPFESPMAIMVADRGRFFMHDMREGRFYIGSDCAASIEKLLNIPLNGTQAAALFMGRVPVIDYAYSICRWDSRGYYTIDLMDARGRHQNLRISPDSCHSLMGSTLSDGDGLFYSIEMSGKAPGQSGCIPGRIEISLPRKDTDVVFVYKKAETGVSLPDAAWKLAIPPGTRVEQLDQGGDQEP